MLKIRAMAKRKTVCCLTWIPAYLLAFCFGAYSVYPAFITIIIDLSCTDSDYCDFRTSDSKDEYYSWFVTNVFTVGLSLVFFVTYLYMTILNSNRNNIRRLCFLAGLAG